VPDPDFTAFIQRVKQRSPIITVVGNYVRDLKRSGRLMQACCPFHEENTASFKVDPERETWRCYGACDRGGDVIQFVMEAEGVDFMDALRLMAEACGEEMPARGFSHDGGDAKRKKDQLRDCLDRAQRLFQRTLASPEGEPARRYLAERGLTPGTTEPFGLGWAPRDGTGLLEAARSAGLDPELLIEAGLVGRADGGRLYDFFRGRLMIPIRDPRGHMVGFGGRQLPEDEGKGGKYVNTRETPLFHKGRLVYGLELARNEVRRTRELILVEGYTDVMAAHQAGLTQTAAVLGTATTPEHVEILRTKGVDRLVLVFDGDAAGQAATQKALRGWLPLDVSIHVVALPSGSDPCDLLVKEGGDAFRKRIEEAPDWFQWCLDRISGLPAGELARGVDDVLGLLGYLKRPTEQDLRLQQMARSLDLSEDTVRQQWDNVQSAVGHEFGGQHVLKPRSPGPGRVPGQDSAQAGADAGPGGAPLDPREVEALRSLIGSLLLDNSLIPLYAGWVDRCPEAGEGRGLGLRRIFQTLLDLYADPSDDTAIDASRVMTALADHPARGIVEGLVAHAQTADSPASLARDQVAWFEKEGDQRELASLRIRLGEARQAQNHAEEADFLSQINQLVAHKNGRTPRTQPPIGAPLDTPVLAAVAVGETPRSEIPDEG